MSHTYTITVPTGKTADLSMLLWAEYSAMDDTNIDFDILAHVSHQTAYWCENLHDEQELGNIW